MKKIQIKTARRTQFINLDSYVARAVQESNVQNGIVIVYVPHTTAGITINENADPDVLFDIEHVLDKVVPWHGDYHHSEGNTSAHVKASLMGSSVQVIINEGKLVLGTWQSIFLCEFDGPRTREIFIKVISTNPS
ncbi:MAG TPA: secondary thiamine-phosphate synthase enzyme YjbQ [Candidatus Hydrogenedens sp.]|nr:secondary thiamine-phosphate synthase enzyme YjbQ [Candidatus Hydrogenedens sp.]HOK08561.1 secondary thiamine-phosphate synthase enzyme YjbQ [Candidatus Hydrogenedens sp.]HOL19049.1 secondary thiamine-phosphate synthase enzyme YjbQ [Candidatus Hydrogenedens sp.]HPP57769.1 secondary thiamine-phosphate synthase enzyme YjbQ [Candidatus Hydrogenedens sp.]